MLTEAQLLARQSGIGASEIAAVCGLDPSKAPIDVWLLKTGRAESDESEQASIGHLLEPVIADLYAQRAGVQLAPCDTRVGPCSWEIATPDRHIVGTDRGVEIKVVGARMAWHWADGVPDYVRCQCQWQMHVLGWSAIVVVALVGGTDFQIHEVPRDQEWIDLMRTVARDFWALVESDTPPEVDGSDGWRGFIKRMFPESNGSLREDESIGALARDYHDLSEQIKCTEQAREVVGNRLRMAIADADGVRGSWGRATNRTNKAGKRTLLVKMEDQ